MGSVTGKAIQKKIRVLHKRLDASILKMTSQKKDKKYHKAHHYELMDDLQFYWDENLPIDDDTNQPYYRKTWFEKLANDHDMSFKNIEAFEKKERPRKFKPKK